MRHPRLVVAASAVLVGASLTGCAPVVGMQAAEHASDPACADVTVRLPDTIAELPRRATDAQATGAWGQPTGVLLYCGVEAPSASTLTCLDIDGNDWLLDDSAGTSYVLRLYGREPAVDLVVDPDAIDPVTAVTALGDALARTTPNGHECLARGELGS